MNDLRYALRMLLKSPGFSFIAIATLALGIGLNTSIFSLINDLFLRDLPFKEPGRVVHMYSNARERKLLELAISAPRFQHYRDAQTIFDGFGAENVFAFTLTGLGDPVQIFGGRVTANYFDVLGVRPVRGRNFLPEEEESADVAMVTENFWQKRMGGDPRVIGRSVTLDGVPHTVVGILPNLPLFLGRAKRRSLDSQALRAPRNFLRTHDARLGFPARRRTIETGNDPGTGAGGITAARTKLPRALSGQDR